MNILEKIIANKKEEIVRARLLKPVEQLLNHKLFSKKTLSLKGSLLNGTTNGIIAEFKRRSPSKAVINEMAMVAEVTKAYTAAGASGLSVLTDNLFFGGTEDDLLTARINNIPLLRKDFIIDEYQLVESKALGADVILLIAACLTKKQVYELASFARQLQMEVLLEIHNEEELGHICDAVDLVGINNRNLKTFSVDINRSIELGKQVPADKIRIAESGIDSVDTINRFREAGFNGFLMGERFMREKDPGEAFKKFAEQLK
jgi:indole-3-glycerol phosphate synthase